MKNQTARRTALRLSCALITPGLWLLFCFSALVAAQDSATYPGKLAIARARHLSPQERAVEARFAAYLEAHTEQAVARYIEKYSNEINVDNARELSSDYAPGGMDAEDPATVAARMRWTEAVHEPASALAKELYRRALAKEAPADRRKQVVFTAGGAGAGKTTSIRTVANLNHAVQLAEIVYDTTLSTFSTALARITDARAAGRMVSIVYVYRDPINALVEGVLPRARITGRTVPLNIILASHWGSAQAILKLADAYKNEPWLAIAIIDNRDGTGSAAQADLEFVRRMAGRYSRESLREALSSALEDAYEKGKRGEKDGISETLYRAIKKPAP